jgi:hypothetical protein
MTKIGAWSESPELSYQVGSRTIPASTFVIGITDLGAPRKILLILDREREVELTWEVRGK